MYIQCLRLSFSAWVSEGVCREVVGAELVSACPVSRWSTERSMWVSVRGGGICLACIGPATCVRGASRFRSLVFFLNIYCLGRSF